MKKIALLALLLSGCASNSQPVSPPTQAPRIAGGTTNDVMWVCSEEEVSDSLVWVKCDFARTTDHPANVCIAVSYYTDSMPGWDWTYVANKKVCSGSKHESTKYVAFTESDRNRLNDFCGKDLTKCTLTAYAAKH